MKRLFLILAGLLAMWGCNSPEPAPSAMPATTEAPQPPQPPPSAPKVPDCGVALQFINDYTAHCSAGAGSDSLWIRHNALLTDNFKNTYYKILEDAWKADPEIGLDADPIFDAQDFPDKGFVLSACDTAGGYVTVRGKDWKDFYIVLKVVPQGDKWLVDGAGIVNIPDEKRAKR